ncbi:acyltransferase family protein [Crenothrix polyspora]|uniref:Acyltransferase 3 n=1 Tax=Crenothrix polyspora TaxID=360316 RepID=A0A1R4H2Y3_9GAMM|nr:acyltransferase family protein [Crenothrix polyspora]SJM90584.1 Acyltransferase 3 [Crenothrix polyspora]
MMEKYSTNPLTTSPHYRPDIDGLRAVAVLLVVGFHAFPEWLKGGFIGVDIFFVISGFLISRIILTDITRQHFSFRTFYTKRIKRIFPALIVVLSACFGVGWFILLPDEFKELGKHIAGGAGFVANLVLWSESGYFDNQAELKPLLHLWSLGIEEQFYFVWPVVLIIATKKRYNLLWLMLAFILASFVFNIRSVHTDPISDFYSPFTRFWELMAGSLLAYLSVLPGQSHRPLSPTEGRGDKNNKRSYASLLKNTAAFIGGLCIAIAVFYLDKTKAFPGWWAILPVLGATLLIFAGTTAWFNKKLLAHPALVFIGLISFPLYLWHWPLLSFARIMVLGTPTLALRLSLVAASIFLAWLTYRIVEQPIRFGANTHHKTTGLCVLLTLLLAVGYSTQTANGFAFRMQDKVDYSEFFAGLNYTHSHHLVALEHHECNFYDIEKSTPRAEIDSRCYTPHSKNVVFLWGDSHMQHLNYGLTHNLPTDVSLLQAGASGCPPTTQRLNPDPLQTCNKANQFILEKIQQLKPKVVILAQQKNHENNDYDKTILHLKAAGVAHIILVGPVPQWQPFLYKIMLRQHWMDYPQRMNTHLDKAVLHTDTLLHAKYNNSKEVRYVSLINPLCDKHGCITYLNNDRKEGLITYDYGHFTLVASDFVAKTILMPVIRGFI